MYSGYYIPIITYNGEVLEDHPTWAVSPYEFKRQMKYLYENGYTPIFAKEFYDYYNTNTEPDDSLLPEKPVLIMLDGSSYETYTICYPVLKEYNFKFCLGLSPDLIQVTTQKDGTDNTYYLTWQQVQEMVESGLAEITNQGYELSKYMLQGYDDTKNVDVWGSMGVKLWRDNGIYANEDSAHCYPNIIESSIPSIPFAGTTYDYQGNLVPVKTYLGFYATKSMTVDRLVLKTAMNSAKNEGFTYETKVRVIMGERDTAVSFVQGRRAVVCEDWEPWWIQNSYQGVVFDEPFTIEQGKWYNIYFETKTVAEEEAVCKCFVNPTVDFSFKNCATNSHITEYEAIEEFTLLHHMPLLIASNGSGSQETDQQYITRINNSYATAEQTIEERVGGCVTKIMHFPLTPLGENINIGIMGAANNGCDWWYIDTSGTEPSLESEDRWYHTPVVCYFKVRFSQSFSAKMLCFENGGTWGNYFNNYTDVYFGAFENNRMPDYTHLTLIRKAFSFNRSPKKYPTVEIQLENEIQIQANTPYIIGFVTTNRGYMIDEDTGNTVENNYYFKINCTALPRVQNETEVSVGYRRQKNPTGGSVDEVTFWTNTRLDKIPDVTYFDGDGDAWNRGQVYPSIWFVEETSTYPTNKYTIPNKICCYPLGSYTDDGMQVLVDRGYIMAFSNFKGIFDHRPNQSINISDSFMEIPRTFISVNTPDFRYTIPHLTTEIYRKDMTHFPYSTMYAYIIHQPDTWISSSNAARARINDVDVAIFDGIEIGERRGTYDYDLHINIDFDLLSLYQQRKKRCLLLFGGYAFNPDYEHDIFVNKTNTIDMILDYVDEYNFDGVSIDFEEVYAEDRQIASEWFEELAYRCHTNEKYLEVHVAAPYPFANYSETATTGWDAWFDYARIAACVDKIMPMTYLDHRRQTEPGPITDWDKLQLRYTYLIETLHIDPAKICGGLSCYGTGWFTKGFRNQPEGEIWAWDMGNTEFAWYTNGEVIPEYDRNKDAWHIVCNQSFVGEIWFEAPNTFAHKVKYLRSLGINSYGVWCLGMEDDGYWRKGFACREFKKNYPVHQIT